ncbi:sulfite exporter TauE/SafE family protein [Halostreptopolyspora alba]|uniref:Probable membrane transporter protein n=1 Tax=Halostreptopolyspora alba TaxID=2487137 RepID=A0A3N0EBZ5_9ACTN|nr:sulfite exporter TauE/SafE family protein [Nocardiopsaceae bacterium YIM 96095]
MDTDIVIALLGVAAAAGWLDAVVGGGGLVLLPALLAAAPSAPVATLLGTNKLSSIFGLTSAAASYARKVTMDRRVLLATVALALAGSALGAGLAGALSNEALRPLVMLVLLLALVVVVLYPGMGATPDPGLRTPRRVTTAVVVAGVGLSLYDGLAGPGTGVFLVLVFTTIIGLDFVRASASAKVVNVATNLGALTVFALNGHVMWGLGVGLAACSVLGAHLGARTAIRRGAGFVRLILVVVVLALFTKLGYDQFLA